MPSVVGASPDEYVAGLRSLVERGYRAAKTGLPLFYGRAAEPAVTRSGYFGTPGEVAPSLKETEYLPTSAIDRIATWFAAARDAVGADFELMVCSSSKSPCRPSQPWNTRA